MKVGGNIVLNVWVYTFKGTWWQDDDWQLSEKGWCQRNTVKGLTLTYPGNCTLVPEDDEMPSEQAGGGWIT